MTAACVGRVWAGGRGWVGASGGLRDAGNGVGLARWPHMPRWMWRLAPDAGRGVRQEGRPLGERLHAAWEWGAVLEQAAEFGWTALDVRWGQATHAHPHAHAHACKEPRKGPSARGTCHPPHAPTHCPLSSGPSAQ